MLNFKRTNVHLIQDKVKKIEALESGGKRRSDALFLHGFQAIKDQADLIAASGAGYALVTDAYMEEQPFIADWDKMADTSNVVVVPFFISDGLHSYQDIPVLLGLESEVGPAASHRGGPRSPMLRNDPGGARLSSGVSGTPDCRADRRGCGLRRELGIPQPDADGGKCRWRP